MTAENAAEMKTTTNEFGARSSGVTYFIVAALATEHCTLRRRLHNDMP
jgi:hypothetical protein